MKTSREELLQCIEKHEKAEMEMLIKRYNSLILFDPKIELIESSDNELTAIINLSN